MNSMPPAWLAYMELVPTSKMPQPQAQARPRFGTALAMANATHEIFTIVSRMKISAGSAAQCIAALRPKADFRRERADLGGRDGAEELRQAGKQSGQNAPVAGKRSTARPPRVHAIASRLRQPVRMRTRKRQRPPARRRDDSCRASPRHSWRAPGPRPDTARGLHDRQRRRP